MKLKEGSERFERNEGEKAFGGRLRFLKRSRLGARARGPTASGPPARRRQKGSVAAFARASSIRGYRGSLLGNDSDAEGGDNAPRPILAAHRCRLDLLADLQELVGPASPETAILRLGAVISTQGARIGVDFSLKAALQRSLRTLLMLASSARSSHPARSSLIRQHR